MAAASSPALQDLRVVDARGERVPFAVLAPRAAESQSRSSSSATPCCTRCRARPAAGRDWRSPVEVMVQGDRISVKRSGTAPGQTGAVSLRADG